MMADVPVGLFLSGGVDSSAVAALMRGCSSGRLPAFTVGYDEPAFMEELTRSRRVARLFDFEHHEVALGEQDLIDSVDDVLYHLDEPNADWATFPLYHLAREARRSETPVILAGEGGDETFVGYPGYLRAARLARVVDGLLRRVPAARLALRLLAPLLQAAEWAGGRGRGLLDDLERVARGEPVFIGLQIGLPERLKRRVLEGAGFSVPRPSAAVAPYIARALSRPPRLGERGAWSGGGYGALCWIGYLELKQRLPEMLLMRLDKMTMAHGVEGRVPFLDHELVAFVTALPASLHLRGGVTKYLLKRAAEVWLPPDVVHQPKRAFGAPVARWLRGQLGRHVEGQVAESRLVREGILRGGTIRALIAAHRDGRAEYSQAIWSLYSVCRWYDAVLEPMGRGRTRSCA